MVKNMSFYNMVLALLTYSVLEFYWHFEMWMNLNIFITTVKALKKNSVCVCMCECIRVCVCVYKFSFH